MNENFSFLISRLMEKLWVRPLIFCLLSIAGALVAHLADDSFITDIAPSIQKESLEDLLSTISGAMLVIAIFAVGAMLSALSAASSSATPRSFQLLVSDDISQNALSVYIGSFIFSIVADIALKNGYYGKAGYFVLLILTIGVFTLVILTFLRWVERISKLGRLGHTMKKVEDATAKMIQKRLDQPLLGGIPVKQRKEEGIAVFVPQTGYIQHINIELLQRIAEEKALIFTLNCLPGIFATPDKPILHIVAQDNTSSNIERENLEKVFIIDDTRSFHDDPRFGLIALSEIASRALSPGINDPGTAIAIIGSHVRLFCMWLKKGKKEYPERIKYDRVEVPEIALTDIFEDAFRAIARDGAGNIEVMIRLQKAFATIAHIGSEDVREIASLHAQYAYQRAELAMESKMDIALLKEERFSK